MITKRTVLILGAGASVDYGFPLGRGLITTICNSLASPNSALYKLLRDCDCPIDEIREFQLHLNNSNLPSIDAFLENRKEFERIGKLAIAGALIPFETKSALDRSQKPLRWYEYLHGKLIGRRLDFFSNKITVVTFNYDRSFEYALFLAIKYSYGLNDEECEHYIQTIPIIHIYGQLGKPFWRSKAGRPYKPDLTPEHAGKCAKSIKVLHEGEQNSPELQDAQEALSNAQVICCLGFGYHSENINRLRLPNHLNGTNAKAYFSMFGFKEQQRERILDRLYPKGRPLSITYTAGKENQDVLTFLQATAALE